MPVPNLRHVRCPQCGAKVPWTAASRFKPFCSERCKLIDLGEWAAERYRIPAGGTEQPGESDPSLPSPPDTVRDGL